jgi:hypothetical protein
VLHLHAQTAVNYADAENNLWYLANNAALEAKDIDSDHQEPTDTKTFAVTCCATST